MSDCYVCANQHRKATHVLRRVRLCEPCFNWVPKKMQRATIGPVMKIERPVLKPEELESLGW